MSNANNRITSNLKTMRIRKKRGSMSCDLCHVGGHTQLQYKIEKSREKLGGRYIHWDVEIVKVI